MIESQRFIELKAYHCVTHVSAQCYESSGQCRNLISTKQRYALRYVTALTVTVNIHPLTTPPPLPPSTPRPANYVVVEPITQSINFRLQSRL